MSSSSITVCSVDFVAEEGEVTCEEQAYCTVTVQYEDEDGATQADVCVSVGCPDWQLGSLRASGAGVRPFCRAWWTDSSDWCQLPSGEAAEAALEAIEEQAYSLYREAVAARPVPEKSGVGRSDWETVATYCVTDSADDLVVYEVEVQVGYASAGGSEAWFLRTTDDAGGDDVLDDTSWDSAEAAVEAAEAFARENDETDGLAPAEYRRRALEERAGEPDDEGEWCVWWCSLDDDERVVARYATREAAEAAAQIAQDGLASHQRGRLLCGYEVRALVEGEWVSVDDLEVAS